MAEVPDIQQQAGKTNTHQEQLLVSAQMLLVYPVMKTIKVLVRLYFSIWRKRVQPSTLVKKRVYSAKPIPQSVGMWTEKERKDFKTENIKHHYALKKKAGVRSTGPHQ